MSNDRCVLSYCFFLHCLVPSLRPLKVGGLIGQNVSDPAASIHPNPPLLEAYSSRSATRRYHSPRA
jgi:hypothetical protein